MDSQVRDEVLTLAQEKKFNALLQLLRRYEPADMADLLQDLPDEQLPIVFRLLSKETAAYVFVEMDTNRQEFLIGAFSDHELRDMINEMYLDDTVDVIEEMPASLVTRILKNTDSDTRAAINTLLAYPKDSAGSIMTTEFVRLSADMTVEEAFRRIRRVGTDSETIYTCYVTDNRRLIGVISVQTMLLSDPEAKIGEIMTTNVISVSTHDDKESVAALLARYDFLALPVVDSENRAVGIITVDDAIDVLSEEDEEDFSKMAAITPDDRPYLKTSPFRIFKSRIPWLLLLMVSATFTGLIISSFESALAVQAVLTAFIPMLMGTGGNAGSQASVTVIRGLSLDEIHFRDIGKVVLKELMVSLLTGLSLGAATFAKLMLIDRPLMGADITLLVAVAVSLTLALTVVLAKLIGCTMPLLAKRLGFDPAVMASPFITTLVDALSLLLYFTVASMMLGI